MIVKDSAETVEKALESVLPVVGQIVVVDTGSLDKTVSLCASKGAEVHFMKWTDNFSEARNYCLNFIRRPWVLMLDSDEELDARSLEGIMQYLDDNKIGGFSVDIINNLEGNSNSVSVEHKYTRIFRSNANIRFTGRIHEQIAPSITSSGLEIIDSKVKIYHSGYSGNNPEKAERNIALLKKELSENPDDDWLKYHLAESLFALNNNLDAKTIYEFIIDSKQLSIEQTEKLKLRLAQIALKENDFSKALQYCSFETSDRNREGLRQMIRAVALTYLGDYEKAKAAILNEDIAISTLVDSVSVENLKKILNV
jgi:glycosyltransferase involved in cell wall biosynthesis